MRLTIGRALAAASLAVAACVGPAALAQPNQRAATSAGWHWNASYHLPGATGGINGLACPSTSLCVAVSSTTKIYWTKKPSGARTNWKSARLEPANQPGVQGAVIFDDVSCPSAHFCAAVDDIGNVFYSTDPTGGRTTWHAVAIDSPSLQAISCASSHLCAALDSHGQVLTATNPSGPWHTVRIITGPAASYYDVSCAGVGTCVAVEANGRVYSTASADKVSPKWHSAKLGTMSWDGVSCASAHKCVVVGSGKSATVGVSKNPTGHAAAWRHTALGGGSFGFGKVDCPTGAFCLAIGGNTYLTNSAAAIASHWHKVKLPTNGSQTAVSCPTAKVCFVGTSTDEFIAGHKI